MLLKLAASDFDRDHHKGRVEILQSKKTADKVVFDLQQLDTVIEEIDSNRFLQQHLKKLFDANVKTIHIIGPMTQQGWGWEILSFIGKVFDAISGAAGFLTPNYFALSSYTLLSKPSLTQIDE